MKLSKARRIAAAGWEVGSAKKLLGLSNEEEALIEMKLSLASSLKKLREASGLTQNQFAKRLGSSQSRVAKLEAADPSVSIDLLVRSLLVLGSTQAQVGRIVGRKAKIPAA